MSSKAYLLLCLVAAALNLYLGIVFMADIRWLGIINVFLSGYNFRDAVRTFAKLND